MFNVYPLGYDMAGIRPCLLGNVSLAHDGRVGSVFGGIGFRFALGYAFGASGIWCGAHGVYHQSIAFVYQRAVFVAGVDIGGDCFEYLSGITVDIAGIFSCSVCVDRCGVAY